MHLKRVFWASPGLGLRTKALFYGSPDVIIGKKCLTSLATSESSQVEVDLTDYRHRISINNCSSDILAYY